MNCASNSVPIEIPTYELRRGHSDLIVSMPHVGTYLPSWLLPRLTDHAKLLLDTDWHLDVLYDFLESLDATVIIATHSRYVIDLNRSTDNSNLYPGQNTTSLCPTDSFNLQPLYLANKAPGADEIIHRTSAYWVPYHCALQEEIDRIKAVHGCVKLWDAHSIHSQVPRFFEGKLPHLNIGTVDNHSCAPSLTNVLGQVIQSFPEYSSVINGRFKGGYITRHYGQPKQHIHAVQLEISLRSYMHEMAPYQLDVALSRQLRPVLKAMLVAMQQWEALS